MSTGSTTTTSSTTIMQRPEPKDLNIYIFCWDFYKIAWFMSDFGVSGVVFVFFQTFYEKVGEEHLLDHGRNNEQSRYIMGSVTEIKILYLKGGYFMRLTEQIFGAIS